MCAFSINTWQSRVKDNSNYFNMIYTKFRSEKGKTSVKHFIFLFACTILNFRYILFPKRTIAFVWSIDKSEFKKTIQQPNILPRLDLNLQVDQLRWRAFENKLKFCQNHAYFIILLSKRLFRDLLFRQDFFTIIVSLILPKSFLLYPFLLKSFPLLF